MEDMQTRAERRGFCFMGYITNRLEGYFDNRNSALFPARHRHKPGKTILLMFLCKENSVNYA